MVAFVALQLVMTAERRRKGDMACGGEYERRAEGVPTPLMRRLLVEIS